MFYYIANEKENVPTSMIV